MGREGGGSTLTQQLAKALLDHERKSKAIRVIQKLKEWIIAVKLERNFTKEELLALYLNAVPFSDNVFGIRNASKTFFQKEPYQLNIEESALLVGMINGPGLYNPRRNPKASMIGEIWSSIVWLKMERSLLLKQQNAKPNPLNELS